MLKFHELRQAKGKVTDEIQEAVNQWVKTRSEINIRANLRRAGFNAKDIDAMIKTAVENAQAKADAEAKAKAKAEKKGKNK